ncbi:MAG: hypothetical protein JWM68_212 [Verrucomicrobiales bacterium]|nr:hypothetical protein [Verrucomicrobiales bacterium]
MKQLKYIAGILLATVAAMAVLGTISFLLNPDPDVPWWIVGVMFVLGLVPFGGAFLLLRDNLTVASRPCPKCKSAERRIAGVLRRPNKWAQHIGGILLASLWGASRGQQVQCIHCNTLYLTQTRGSRIAGILLWIFLLLALSGVVLP